MEAEYFTVDKILAIVRRHAWRGPFYRASRYRRLRDVRPQRKSEYAAVRERRRIDEAIQKRMDRVLAPGSWLGDLHRAGQDIRENWESALRLAKRFPWSLGKDKDPDVFAALNAWARDEETSIEVLKREVLANAIIHVRQQISEKQTVRTKHGYARAEDGSVWVGVPNNRPAVWTDAWVKSEVRKAAAAYVLATPYPASGKHTADVLTGAPKDEDGKRRQVRIPLDAAVALVGDDEGPLRHLLEDEEHRERTDALHDVLALATDKERAYLKAYLSEGSHVRAADSLGISEDTGKKMHRRLVRRARKKLPVS